MYSDDTILKLCHHEKLIEPAKNISPMYGRSIPGNKVMTEVQQEKKYRIILTNLGIPSKVTRKQYNIYIFIYIYIYISLDTTCRNKVSRNFQFQGNCLEDGHRGPWCA